MVYQWPFICVAFWTIWPGQVALQAQLFGTYPPSVSFCVSLLVLVALPRLPSVCLALVVSSSYSKVPAWFQKTLQLQLWVQLWELSPSFQLVKNLFIPLMNS